MRFGNRGSRSSDARRYTGFRPRRETLEDRLLLAIDLGGSLPPALPNVATTNPANTPPGPFGVVLGGAVAERRRGLSASPTSATSTATASTTSSSGRRRSTTNAAGNVVQGGTATSAAYLVYGSQQVNAHHRQQRRLAHPEYDRPAGRRPRPARVQRHPDQPDHRHAAGFAYSGIRFITSSNPNSLLGASVSVVRGHQRRQRPSDRRPGRADDNGANPGTGRLISSTPTPR